MDDSVPIKSYNQRAASTLESLVKQFSVKSGKHMRYKFKGIHSELSGCPKSRAEDIQREWQSAVPCFSLHSERGTPFGGTLDCRGNMHNI